MDLSIAKTARTILGDKPWLGSKDGTDVPETITLNIAGGSFNAVKEADTTRVGGWFTIPDGVPLKKSGNLYVLAPADAPCDGHLLEPVHSHGGNAGGALLWRGVVIAAKVPLAGFDAATDGADRIRYR